jgi:hypothetical protein
MKNIKIKVVDANRLIDTISENIATYEEFVTNNCVVSFDLPHILHCFFVAICFPFVF